MPLEHDFNVLFGPTLVSPGRLGKLLDSKLGVMQQEGQLPSKDTCDLLILDR
jgi:hypothetical protein